MKILRLFFGQFKTVCDNPFKFVIWIFSSVILSLSSIWLPTIIGNRIGVNWLPTILEGNPIIFFSMIFLSNTVISSIDTVGVGTNTKAVGVRNITIIITILFLFYLVGSIPLNLYMNSAFSSSEQLIILVIAIVIGIYAYGYRDSGWEKGLDNISKDQDKLIASVNQKADKVTSDGEEVKL